MEYKLSVGTGLKRQCLPVAREADKVSARKYILARKDAKGKKTYGYRRIGRRLARNGIYYTLKTVLRVMSVGQSEKRNAGYGEYLHKHPNLLNRDFETEKINQEWVTGSYTCTPSEEGVLVGHQRSVSELRKM